MMVRELTHKVKVVTAIGAGELKDMTVSMKHLSREVLGGDGTQTALDITKTKVSPVLTREAHILIIRIKEIYSFRKELGCYEQ